MLLRRGIADATELVAPELWRGARDRSEDRCVRRQLDLLSARIPRCHDDATQRSTAVFAPMTEIDVRR
jgi:hypothetical protein